MRDIGKNIRDLRTKQNMTQDELAEKLFVTRQTVSNYETGRSRPDVDMLLNIAQALNTDPNTLLYGPAPSVSRKQALLRLIPALLLLFGAYILYSVLYEYCYNLKNMYFRSYPMMWLRVLGTPLLFLLFGWTAMQTLHTFRPIPPFRPETARKVKTVLFCVICLYLLFTVSFILIAPGLSDDYPEFARGWGLAFYTVLGARAGQHSMYSYLICSFFMGALFWLCGFPVGRKDPQAENSDI